MNLLKPVTPSETDVDTTTTMLKILLDPYLPTPELKKKFEPLLPMLARTITLGNFPNLDFVYRLKLFFYSVRLWAKLGLPDVAVVRMAEMIFEVQGTRSIGGFERKMQVTQRTITEAIEEKPEIKRPGLLARIFGRVEEAKEAPRGI
jgi:hypothetical protein